LMRMICSSQPAIVIRRLQLPKVHLCLTLPPCQCGEKLMTLTNLWFINPSGVLFDPNASLDVNGSFHVSTADYLRLADGGRFEATNPENSVLTTAPPEAFGFLDDTPAPITVDRSTLVGQESETLSLVGGDILMQGGTLSAPSGRINLASVASAGLAVLADGGLQMAPLREGAEIQRGDIRISQGSRIEVSGSGGMGVFIRGGRFTLGGVRK
jgi:large exoprotein involved in heme utilization and adhesion